MKNKIFKFIYLIIIYAPILLNGVVFYSYVHKAIKQLGYTPYYNHPDPKQLIGMASHRQLVYDVSNVEIITLIAIFVGFILSFILKGDFFKKLRIHYLIALILMILFTFSSLMEWFLD